MTTDAEKLAVMEGAIKHGKRVQRSHLRFAERTWVDDSCPVWNWYGFDYRLAPERKKAKVWVNLYSDGDHTAYNEKERALRSACRSDAIAVPVEVEYEEGYGLEDRT